ncbi:hypothetical protein OAN96_00855 [Candidatus Gracilibacteria bacterium]|nr:hypothetical protein [Candidatus Gracilibacteria bacterium]
MEPFDRTKQPCASIKDGELGGPYCLKCSKLVECFEDQVASLFKSDIEIQKIPLYGIQGILPESSNQDNFFVDDDFKEIPRFRESLGDIEGQGYGHIVEVMDELCDALFDEFGEDISLSDVEEILSSVFEKMESGMEHILKNISKSISKTMLTGLIENMINKHKFDFLEQLNLGTSKEVTEGFRFIGDFFSEQVDDFVLKYRWKRDIQKLKLALNELYYEFNNRMPMIMSDPSVSIEYKRAQMEQMSEEYKIKIHDKLLEVIGKK